MIPDDVVDQVREAADIVQVIGEYVNLKRTGADYRGPCPFHQGTHRNFSVSPRKEMYYCFVCHEGGDVFDFLRKRLGLDFVGAVKHVASRVGIEVREVEARREGADPREPLWEINASAADYFRTQLWDEEAGRAARDYLALRRVSREVADRFGLGFAPREGDALRAHMVAIGLDEGRLEEAGLLYHKEEGGELRSRFRNRLIFPILDAAGHHVGFGGRLLGPGEPKYLNSSDSPLFSKAALLYGLSWAKNAMRREDRVIVVEGYFDVVRLATAGFESVVAPLGTALTDRQAALLRRYTGNAFLLYDSDRAGLKATFRAGDEMLRQGFAVQVVTLPEGEDPDSFVDKYGGPKLEQQLAASIDVFERKVQLLERGGWFADLRQKRRALDRLLPTIRATADAVTRDLYTTRASEAAGVSKDVLQREAEKLEEARIAEKRSRANVPATRLATASAADTEAEKAAAVREAARAQRVPRQSAEAALVRLMLLQQSRVERLAEIMEPSTLQHPQYQEIYKLLLTSHPAEIGIESFAVPLDELSAYIVAEMLESPEEILDVDRTWSDSIGLLLDRNIDQELTEIDQQLPIAGTVEKDGLIKRKMALVQERKALGIRRGPYGKSRP
ncbi:MAG: DNA primase [Gemmatimonadaceae bacterium]